MNFHCAILNDQHFSFLVLFISQMGFNVEEKKNRCVIDLECMSRKSKDLQLISDELI